MFFYADGNVMAYDAGISALDGVGATDIDTILKMIIINSVIIFDIMSIDLFLKDLCLNYGLTDI